MSYASTQKATFVLATVFAGACAASGPPAPGRGGYRDLEVPTRWGDYPLAGALARLGSAPGLDWVDHLTNCGLSNEWIEDMTAAWWSERSYDVSTLLEAKLDAPIARLGGIGHSVESVRIRYGKIGGETTAETRLYREAREKRLQLLAACPLIEEADVFWIDEAIYADEVTITLETARGDTLSGDIVRGLLKTGGHWSISENGTLHTTERVYVAFRNATPARSLVDAELAETELAALFGIGDLTYIPPQLNLPWIGAPRLRAIAEP